MNTRFATRPAEQPCPHFCPNFCPLQERLLRTTLPCDTDLARAAAQFFAVVIREAGGGPVTDDLLAAAATYVHSNCRLLSSQVGVACPRPSPSLTIVRSCCALKLMHPYR